jgi:hypothetical protein
MDPRRLSHDFFAPRQSAARHLACGRVSLGFRGSRRAGPFCVARCLRPRAPPLFSPDSGVPLTLLSHRRPQFPDAQNNNVPPYRHGALADVTCRRPDVSFSSHRERRATATIENLGQNKALTRRLGETAASLAQQQARLQEAGAHSRTLQQDLAALTARLAVFAHPDNILPQVLLPK